MQLAFGWYNIIELLFCLAVLWMGIRDLQGKDPLIHTFFNKYDRDPEYRAMWQKKNGVWEIFNAMVLASSQFLGNFPTLSNWARTIALVVDAIYLILYEIWEHSAD